MWHFFYGIVSLLSNVKISICYNLHPIITRLKAYKGGRPKRRSKTPNLPRLLQTTDFEVENKTPS